MRTANTAAKAAKMTDRITAHFTLTKPEMVEGISVASKALLLPWQSRTASIAQLVIAVFAGLGAMSLFMAAYKAMFGNPPPFYIAPIVFLVVGGFGLVQFGMVLDWMATRALAMEDPTGTHMDIDATGLHIWATHEDRRLGWHAIHSLTQGKTAIFIAISGAAFILPNRVLEDPKAAFSQLQTWKAAHA